MIKNKGTRERGKIKLSRYFQKLNIGDRVNVVREHAISSTFPIRLQGRTGIVEEKRGREFIIRLKDLNKEKRFIIHPVHLKKLK